MNIKALNGKFILFYFYTKHRYLSLGIALFTRKEQQFSRIAKTQLHDGELSI